MSVAVHDITCPTCNAPAVEHIEAWQTAVDEFEVDTRIECSNPDCPTVADTRIESETP